MNTENVQPSLENKGHLAIQNINPEIVQGRIEQRGPLAIENTQPLAVEYILNYCRLCTTPTDCTNYAGLARHINIFHKAFLEEDKGIKKDLTLMKVIQKSSWVMVIDIKWRMIVTMMMLIMMVIMMVVKMGVMTDEDGGGDGSNGGRQDESDSEN